MAKDAYGFGNFNFKPLYYLLAADGTEFFVLIKCGCNNCCTRNHRDVSKTYYHQIVAGTTMHPDHREVFPLRPEPIVKSDGQKNDCEKNASKRFLEHFRREHPHLPVIVVEDTLSFSWTHNLSPLKFVCVPICRATAIAFLPLYCHPIILRFCWLWFCF